MNNIILWRLFRSSFLSINWLKNHRNYYWTYLFLYVTQKASYYANCKMVLTLRNNTSLSLGYSKEKCAQHSWIKYFSCQTNHIIVYLWHFTILYDSEISFISLVLTVLYKYIISLRIHLILKCIHQRAMSICLHFTRTETIIHCDIGYIRTPCGY